MMSYVGVTRWGWQVSMKKKIILTLLLLSFVACNKPSRTISQDDPEKRIEESRLKLSHTQEFRSSNAHAHEYFKARNICAHCHGFDFEGGKVEASCKDCHNYPHPTKWALPENHGKAYLASIPRTGEDEKKPSSCLICHNEKSHLKEHNPDEFVSCSSCHTSIPHTEDFKYGEHNVLARTYEGKCTKCHTDLARLLPNMESGCKDCHDEENTVPRVRWEKAE